MTDTENTPVALVTGGAIRVGAAIVRELAARGYQVAIHANTSWFASGQKQYEERYRNGKKEGRGAAWDDQGKLLWERKYHNDEVIDLTR